MLRVLSILGLVLMAACLLGLWAVRSLFSPLPAVIAVQAAAACIFIWARLTFGLRSFHAAANPTEGGLVTTGPYRFIRHPIYTAACLFAWAGAAAHGTPAGLAFAAVMTAGAIVRMLCEEQMVTARYPEYREYARRTKRMVPFVF
ncbi:MAG: methyltransferase family protein [Thermoanaerobaculia bacterium]